MTCYIRERQEKLPRHPCACGCGELIPIKSMRNKPMFYKEGHQFVGERHYNWKGGRYKHKGYWYILKPDHPFADNTGYIPEHRWIYEQHYKVCLLPWIEIHHKNEQRDDNRIENLMPVTKLEHRREHMTDMNGRICIDCGTNETKERTDSKSKRPRWHGNSPETYRCSKFYMKWYDKYKRK
jgi:predicted Zn-ribbon and HTH transcriptional regulator